MAAKVFSATASLATINWNGRQNSTTNAKQGRYDNDLKVGFIHFSTLNSINWATKNIQKITFKFKHGESGKYNGDNKTFGLCESKYQVNITSDIAASNVYGKELVSFTRACSKNTYVEDLILSPTSDVSSFNNIVNYLKSSATINTFCLFKNDPSQSSGATDNYLQVTEAMIEIEYSEGAMYYGKDNVWIQCFVYYGIDGKWEQVSPYYGVNETWQQT